MAKKTRTIVELTDDLDGSTATQTIAFSYDGKNYEIDLNKKNASSFTKVMKPYVDSARTVRATRTRGTSRRASSGGKRADLADVRSWAKSNGYEVSDRGRIPAGVIEAYDNR